MSSTRRLSFKGISGCLAVNGATPYNGWIFPLSEGTSLTEGLLNTKSDFSLRRVQVDSRLPKTHSTLILEMESSSFDTSCYDASHRHCVAVSALEEKEKWGRPWSLPEYICLDDSCIP
jgi:hypothetical protein